jgi:cytochrome c
MTRRTVLTSMLMTGAAALLVGAAMPSFAVDEDAATALAKKSNCTKCHSVDKKKDGPSFKETAAKYKKEGDGEKKLYTHLTTHPKIKVDGKEEEHTSPKTTDEAEIKNLIAYILSR